MKQPRDQHWADLLVALEREADARRGHKSHWTGMRLDS
jgi:hypothetical protein